MRKLFLLVFVSLIALFVQVGVAHAEEKAPSRTPPCGEYIYNNYDIPGMITNETWYTPTPDYIIGKAVWYAPGMMEATARWRGMSLKGFKGGVAMPSPSDIGQIVWLRRAGGEWEGPFLVVDTSQRNHAYYHVVHVGQSIEVDFDTALEWGIVSMKKNGKYKVNKWSEPNVEAYKGLRPPENNQKPIDFISWYKDMANYCSTEEPNQYWDIADAEFTSYIDYKEALVLRQAIYIAKVFNISIKTAKNQAVFV